MTFSLLTCTVAVEDAAQNHFNSAQNVCQKKAAQFSLVQISQLEDILWFVPRDWSPKFGTGLNIIIGIDQKVNDRLGCYFAKMIFP